MRATISVTVLALATIAAATLAPRASPSSTPCPQRYVCPEPQPYAGTPETGESPPSDQFKCRIGWSSNDANFAFCFYEKDTGSLVRSTPSGIQAICWDHGMANPACGPARRRRVLPRRVTRRDDIAASAVAMRRFAVTPTSAEEEDD